MKALYLLLFVKFVSSIPFPSPDYDKKCDDVCNVEKCDVTINCKHGVTKDSCGCCDVCLRKEGEPCGGIKSSEGSCDKGYFCNIRHPLSHKNIFLPDGFKMGKCEKNECKDVSCGIHQWCSIIDGTPTCKCQKKCSDETSFPVCGLSNNIQYKNMCELKKDECEKQTKIVHLPGTCAGCKTLFGMMYEHGKVLKTGKLCEEKTCTNGVFKKSVDMKCLKENNYDCTISNDRVSNCPDGHFCKISRKSKRRGYPDLGKCMQLEPDFCYIDERKIKITETFVDSKCSAVCTCNGFNTYSCVSLCPPQAAICGSGQTLVEMPEEVSKTPKCYCKIPRCVDNEEICKRKPEAGSCYGYFRRWYFDSKSGDCKRFIFGGCRGNGNNYGTEVECLNKCKPVIEVPPLPDIRVPELNTPGKIPTNEDKLKLMDEPGEVIDSFSDVARIQADEPSPFSQTSETRRQGPKLSNGTMTIKGSIIFPHKVGKVPTESCLTVKFQDISMADAPSVTIATIEVDLSEADIGDHLSYVLDSKKPVNEASYLTYSVSATLNYGWCRSKEKGWVHEGDYLSDTTHRIELKADTNDYEKDIELICYSCPSDRASKDKKISNSTPVIESDDSEPLLTEVSEVTDDIPVNAGEGGENKEVDYSVESLTDDDDVTSDEEEEYKTFPFGGTAPGPKLSDKTMTIKGYMKFPRTIGSLPTPSCVRVRFDDVSAQDVSAISLATANIDVSGSNMDKSFAYIIDSKKPIENELWRTFSISATLNRGWCPSEKTGSEWLREGDFYIDTNHDVTLKKDQDEYDVDITMIENKKVEITVPKDEDEDEDAKEEEGEGVVIGNDDTIKSASTVTVMDNKTIDQNGPKLGNTFMEVRFSLKFNQDLGKLPNGSCLKYVFSDVTIQDASEFIIKEKVELVGGKMLKDMYTIGFNKPEEPEYTRTFQVAAVLNVGWCPTDIDEDWIHEGDYQTDVSHKVQLTQQNIYIKELNMTRYCITSQCKPSLTNLKDCVDAVSNVTYVHGDEWERDSCTQCECLDGIDTCLVVDCITCRNPIFVEGQCCPICNDDNVCTDRVLNKDFNDGEEWEQDACTKCTCRKGNKVCMVADCERISCDNPITIEGECCPQCPISATVKPEFCFDEEMDQRFSEGESWKRDSCTDCFCENGSPICAVSDCYYGLVKPCKNPIYTPGVCCPTCEDEKICTDDYTNTTYNDGETWKVSPCKDCECREGDIICSAMGCAELNCRNPVQQLGKCCPTCTNVTDESAPIVTDPCASVKCAMPSPEECDNPITKPGECCPTCPEKTCLVKEKDKVYMKGESWQKDPCTTCTCVDGKELCAKETCAPLGCSNQTYTPGKCCPKCPDPPQEKCIDKRTGHKYKNGELWVEADGCTRCTCIMGHPYCASPKCAYPECPNGDLITVKGICCPVCSTKQICTDTKTKRLYVEGNYWQDNNCTFCKCTSEGTVCEAPNKDLEDCSLVVRMNRYCDAICLDKPDEKKEEEKEEWVDP